MTLRLLVSHWQLAPGVLAVVGLCGLAYLQGVARARGRWPRRRTVAFLAGLLCIVIALQSGLDGYDDRLLSVHMVQHMILLMLAPLLLLAGQPLLLLIRALPRPQQRRAVARALRRVGADRRPPVVSGLLQPSWSCSRICRASTTRPFATRSFTTANTSPTWSPGCCCGGLCSVPIRFPAGGSAVWGG